MEYTLVVPSWACTLVVITLFTEDACAKAAMASALTVANASMADALNVACVSEQSKATLASPVNWLVCPELV
jgi:hypothetical protein